MFAQVNDLHKWDAWSPWAKLDPNAKISFEGPEAGQGAAMSWAGNDKVGEGKMTVVESRPDDAVKLKVDFVKPFEGTSNSEFAFKPEGEGTAVTWAMSAHHNFLEKAMCLVMNGKKMIGDDMEKGLAQLKSVTENGQVGEQLTALLLALADMIELRFGHLAHAIVAIASCRRSRRPADNSSCTRLPAP